MSGYMAFNKKTGAPFTQYPEEDPRHINEGATESVAPMNTKLAHAMSSSIAGTDTLAEATVPIPPQYLRETKTPRSLLGRVRDYARTAGRYLPTVVDIGNSLAGAGYVRNPYLAGALAVGNIVRNVTDPKKREELNKMYSRFKESSSASRSSRMRHPSTRVPTKTSTALTNFRKPIDIEEVD